MSVVVGDIVLLSVFRVEAYGLWGTHKWQTGSVHVSDFTDDPPIDVSSIPQVGDSVAVQVFFVSPRTEVEYAWGKLVCDFAAKLVQAQKHTESGTPANDGDE